MASTARPLSCLDGFGNRFAEQIRQFHDKVVGLFNAEWGRHGNMLARIVVLDPAEGLGCGIGTESNGCLAVDGIGGIVKFRPSRVDPVGAVQRRIEHVGDVGQHGVGNAERFQDPLVLTVIAGVAVETGNKIELAGAAAFHLLSFGQVLENGEQHGIVAVDVGAVEARGIGIGKREILRDKPLVFRVLDEGGQVVTDDLRHAGGKDRHHFRLVQSIGIFQRLMQVVLTTEHGTVFGHGIGNRRGRLAEVPVEGGAVVRSTPLGTVHKGQAAFKGMGHQLGPERLAGMGRVDDQGLASEVLFLVLLGVYPFGNPFFFLFGYFGNIFDGSICAHNFLLVRPGTNPSHGPDIFSIRSRNSFRPPLIEEAEFDSRIRPLHKGRSSGSS